MLEAGLIIIGLGIIGASYVISEKVENKLQEKIADESTLVKDIWTEKDEKRVRERIDSIVEERVEQAIDRTEDELSRISNEKIISSNEFSEQVLGKIEQNHEEVVFLYNMLNEKEKQMKTLMQEIDTLKTAAEEKAAEVKEVVEKPMTAVDMLEKMNRETAKAVVSAVASKSSAAPVVQLTSSDEKELSQLRAFAKAIEAEEREREEMQSVKPAVQPVKKVQPAQNAAVQRQMSLPDSMEEVQSAEVLQSEEIEEEQKSNRNGEILRLYKQGKSVLEISRALDMGQGEVRLIIDLFQGARS